MIKLLLLFLFFLTRTQGAPRLRQLLEVCRHGARSSIDQFFPQNWQIPGGQLSDQGGRMHFLIGDELRNQLINNLGFLDPQFNIQQIYVRSTPVNRTIMSARSQLLGLYPPGSGPQLTQTQINLALPEIGGAQLQEFVQELGTAALQGQVDAIPVEVKYGKPDLLLLGYDKDCPKAYKLEKDKQASSEFKRGLEPLSVSGLIQAIKRIYGLDNFTLSDDNAWSYADDMIATQFQYPDQNKYNLTLHQLTQAIAFTSYNFYEGIYGDPWVVKVSQTALFNDIVDRFKQCIENDKNIAQLQRSCKQTGQPSDCMKAEESERNRLKFTFYSAHDTNIAGMVAFMKIMQFGIPPPFASTFFFKLYSKTEELTGVEGDYFVEVLFNGASIFTFQDYPSFANFVSEKVYKGDLTEACKIENNPPSKSHTNMFLTIGLPIIIGVLVIAAIMITIYCCCCRKRKKNLEQSEQKSPMIRKGSSDITEGDMSHRISGNTINKSEF